MSNKTHQLSDEMHQYLMGHSVRESAVLQQLRQETASMPNSNMQIAPEQGQFMALLVKLMGVKRILEIGVFTGYSSLCMAQALPEDGHITACDISETYTNMAKRYWAKAGVEHKIRLVLAPALETLKDLEKKQEPPYDMAFIDADKTNYQQYYEHSLNLLRPGGLILVDNVLWSGKVIDPAIDDEDTRAIREFNQNMMQDTRVDLSLLPIADGLTLLMKK